MPQDVVSSWYRSNIFRILHLSIAILTMETMTFFPCIEASWFTPSRLKITRLWLGRCSQCCVGWPTRESRLPGKRAALKSSTTWPATSTAWRKKQLVILVQYQWVCFAADITVDIVSGWGMFANVSNKLWFRQAFWQTARISLAPLGVTEPGWNQGAESELKSATNIELCRSGKCSKRRLHICGQREGIPLKNLFCLQLMLHVIKKIVQHHGRASELDEDNDYADDIMDDIMGLAWSTMWNFTGNWKEKEKQAACVRVCLEICHQAVWTDGCCVEISFLPNQYFIITCRQQSSANEVTAPTLYFMNTVILLQMRRRWTVNASLTGEAWICS